MTMRRGRLISVFSMLALVGGCKLFTRPPPEHPRLWLAGDVHLGSGGAERLRPVTSKLHGQGIVNLEGPVGDATASSEKRLVNGHQACAALFDAGVRVAQVVNNHALDLGDAGIVQTAAELAAAGVLRASSEAPVVLDAGALSFDVESFDLTHGVPADLVVQLRRARGPRPLIVTFHVTAEPLLLPTPELEAATEAALDAGAVVVAAQGTHALAPVKWRGQALVAYGLGNVVFDCACTDEEDALALELKFSPDGGLEDAWVVPLRAGLKGEPAALSADAPLLFQLLENLGSDRLERLGDRARVARSISP